MTDKILKQYYDKLTKEAWLKSALCGLSIGFIAMFVASMVFWLTVSKYFWIAFLVWAVATVGATLLFYFKRYKPTARKIARRVDDLGLEERLLTMTQLKGDDSYIAQKQREDTLAALSRVSASLLKFAISVPLIVIPCVSFVLGAGMTTITGLASSGIIKGGNEIIEEIITPPAVEYEITYEAGEGGMIDGDMFQIVIEGQDAVGVMAVPEEEFIFVEWSDGLTNPYREDKNVRESFTVTAVFQYVENNDGDEAADGDEPGDKPGEEEGDPQPSDKPGDPNEKPGDESQAGGRYEPQNQIRDGETYYGDEYEEAFKDAMDETTQDGDLSEGEKDVIGDYFGAIQN